MKRDNATAVLLAGILACTTPMPHAHLHLGNPADASESSGTVSSTARNNVPIHKNIPLQAQVSGFSGKIDYAQRPARHRYDLSIVVQAHLSKTLSAKQAETFHPVTWFPDGSYCTLGLDYVTNSIAMYKLELKQNRNAYAELRGSCNGMHVPRISGRYIEVRYGTDTTPETPSEVVLTARVD